MEIDLYRAVDELVFGADDHAGVSIDSPTWLSDLEPPWIWLTLRAGDG